MDRTALYLCHYAAAGEDPGGTEFCAQGVESDRMKCRGEGLVFVDRWNSYCLDAGSDLLVKRKVFDGTPF